MSRESATAKAEIEASRAIAVRFRRNPDKVFQELMRACQRTSFASQVRYAYPRGGDRKCRHEWRNNRCQHCEAVLVTGPTVYLAREALRVWGNVWCEMRVLEDTDSHRLIEAVVRDLETNYRKSSQDRFAKIVYRKNLGNIPADERELRELTNRRAAFAERNAALQLLPRDLIEDALDQAHGTLIAAAQKDPEAERKKIIMGFDRLNVTVEMLEELLGHKVALCSPTELTNLRSIWKAIEEGQARWGDYVQSSGDEPQPDKNAKRPASSSAQPGLPLADTASAGPQAPNAPPPQGAGAENKLSGPQIALFWATVKKRAWTEATAHAELAKAFTYTSVKQIPNEPKDVFDSILKHFITTAAPAAASE